MNRILYVQYTNPGGYPPLQHSSRILADAGWQVLFLATGAAGANVLEFPPHRNVNVRRVPFCRAGWRQKLHYFRYCLWVLWIVLTWRPSWVYASDPLSCPVATLLARMPGVRVLYHEHDSPSTSARENWFFGFVLRARRWLGRRADICILPNAERLERFQRECGPLRSSMCVWNCPATGEAAQPREAVKNPIWVLYHGSIVPDRLPPTVLEALALLPKTVNLRVVGYETVGSRGYVARLRRQAQSLNISDRIDFLAPVPRSELLKTTSRSDIGLALIPGSSSDRNFEAMTGASNKVFDYLACGLPAIVSDLPDWRPVFVEPGYAAACDPLDPRSIAAAIWKLAGDPDVMRQMGESGRQRIISEWNYENMFRPVLRRLSEQSAGFPALCDRGESPAARRSI